MSRFRVTLSNTDAYQIITADTFTQDPHWTLFTNRVEKKGESDTLIASFQSGYVVSVINMDAANV